ncbi:hypothetical protein PIN31009_05545 [Pandoraea iniqua]|uniref:hypothetical protein n=1 Tax=Pandoraea iniqua TaxID=2508288 RepID=UPI001240B142|nr:hypothetical protein [Pandoraea iniqua]VVE59462.1 hypothetical protein PIN31009_05545 [Pandoraea iniqua]
MANINQLSADTNPQLSDQVAIWSQNNGQARKVSLGALLDLLQANLQLPDGLLNASSLYSLIRSQAVALPVGTVAVTVAPFDANGNTVLNIGGQSLTLNVLTGVMQATRDIAAADFWVALDGSLPAGRTLTLQLQTGPVGGPLHTSQFQTIKAGTGNADCFHFSGVLRNPNNVNGRINEGDIIQLIASADASTTLSISRASVTMRPLDGV